MAGSAVSVAESPGDKDALRKTVFKSVAGRVSDARTGLGRIRDAVGAGRKGHGSRPSRDEAPVSGYTSPSISSLAQSSAALTSPAIVGRAFTWKNKPEEYVNGFRKDPEAEPAHPSQGAGGVSASEIPPREIKKTQQAQEVPEELAEGPALTDAAPLSQAGEIRRDLVASNASVADSVMDEGDLHGPFLSAERSADTTLSGLQRRHSIELSRFSMRREPHEARWPRRLTFSSAEEAVLGWDEIVGHDDDAEALDVGSALERQLSTAEVARNLYQHMLTLKQDLGPWVSEEVTGLEVLDDLYGRQQEDLQSLYYQLSEACQHVKQSSQEIVAAERAHVTEAVKDVEVFVAKLEYEINALASKVQDVEDGVRQFEVQVEDAEKRAEELKMQLETESWPHYFVRTLTGIGTGPNITGGPRRRR